MPSYRGIDRDDVLKSIKDALALLKKYPLGSAWNFRLQGFDDPNDLTGLTPLMQLAGARDEMEVVDALNAAGVKTVFPYLDDVFSYHALANTDGVGEDIMRRLVAWGAFAGPTHDSYTHQTRERMVFLLTSYARHVPFNQESIEGIRSAISVYSRDENIIGRAVKAAEMILFIGSAGQDDAGMRIGRIFETLSSHERKLVLHGLGHVTEFEKREIPFVSALNTYGLVVPGTTDEPEFWADQRLVGLYHRFHEVLAPLVKTDDVISEYSTIGDIGRGIGEKPAGFIFAGTRKAAAEIMKAFPDFVLMDFSGKVISPPAASQKPPKNTLKP